MNRLFQTILRALILQLALLLLAFPIFICWGLPLSIASSVGTLIFSPFLTLFLLLSSILFFTELALIPNTYICTLLEYITQLWQFFLSFSSHQWLIGFAKPPLIVLLPIPAITLFLLTHKKLQKPKRQLIALTSLFICIIIVLKLYPYTQKPHTTPIECGKKNLHIISHPSQTIVFDASALGTKTSIDSWISFTLTSELLKKTGRFSIDHFIVRTVSNRTLRTLHKIIEICPIRHLYLPHSQELTTETNHAFNSLKKMIENRGGTVTCIENYHTFMVDLSVQIQIKRAGTKASRRLHVTTIISGITHYYT